MKTAERIWLPLFGVAMLVTFSASSAWAGIPCPQGSCCGDTSGPFGSDVPCGCADIVTTTTVLNLSDPVTRTICPAGGLSVKAGVSLGVSLNLANTTLRGVCRGGTGLSIAPGANTTVTSGRIIGFDTGLYGGGVTDSVVSFVQVLDNCFQGMFLEQSNGNLIELNIMLRNNRAGLNLGETGTRCSATAPMIMRSASSSRAGTNVVSRNITDRNFLGGTVVNGADTLVELNQSNFNESGSGFDIRGTGHEIRRNIARDNGGDGFHKEATETIFDRNRADWNHGFGIREVFVPGPPNTYDHNRCTGNVLGDSSPAGLCR